MKTAKLILQNQRGMAIIMVMTAVALLSFILAEFTYETKLNKLKVYNLQDRTQARLTAEAGIKFAIAKLRIYQEARNLIEKDANVKSILKPSMIEQIVTQPFLYPIPSENEKSAIKKKLITDFAKTILLRGELIVSIELVSGFINPNNLRKSLKKEKNENTTGQERPEEDDEETLAPNIIVEKKLLETLNNAIEAKKEIDEEFAVFYANIKPELLIKELKYYVLHPDEFDDPERAEIEGNYLGSEIIPKHAPLSSLDELYLLEGWDSEIVKLIKDKLTVHEAGVIPLNKINNDQLKLLFPDITPIQIEEFFKYRNGDSEQNIKAQNFKTVEDFKNIIIKKIGVVDEQTYGERVKEFEQAGLKLGVAGKLFKVTSTGRYHDFSYTLTAFIDLPIKPVPLKEKKPSSAKKQGENQTTDQTENFTKNPTKEEEEEKEKLPPQEFLRPRVVEIRVE